ncbi:MAG: hypothetical protein ACKO96_43450, partial [Flammeovirgaceae bacterium]
MSFLSNKACDSVLSDEGKQDYPETLIQIIASSRMTPPHQDVYAFDCDEMCKHHGLICKDWMGIF